MATRVSKTTEAIGNLHQADRQREHATMMQRLGDPLAAAHERLDAQKREDAALEVLKPPELAPTPPGSGEVAVFDYPDPADRNVGLHLFDTLRNPDMMTAQAGLERYKLLLDIGCVELDQDLARTIQPTNSIERMLAGQLASAHYTALRLLARSLDHAAHAADFQSQWQREQNVEACRVANAAARLLSSFNEGALTLQKLRHGGKQVVVVQHVQVQDGGQAVIAGDMTTGGGGLSATGGDPKNGGTMPCNAPSTTPMQRPDVKPGRARTRRAKAQQSMAERAAACTGDTSQAVLKATSMP
jgi:hypothetical protein